MNATSNPISLSVVFSFRNEEEVLPELVKRCRDVFSKEQEKGVVSQYELIFVNDASNDHSLPILMELSQGHNNIKVINMSRIFGVSVCVLAGMEFSSGDAVVYMDADLQDPPEIIPEMLATWLSGENIDVVHTVRRLRKGETKLKMAITKLGYFILNKLTSVNLPVEAGDFKLLSRRAVNHLVALKEKRPFLRGLVCWIGFKQQFIYYDRDPRYAGKTKFNIFSWHIVSNFINSALISYTSLPLMLASFTGLLAIFLDMGVMVHALREKILGRAIPGWTAIMVTILFIGGVQLICIGIIGLYLNMVFEESKKRPNYIIESMSGFDKQSA